MKTEKIIYENNEIPKLVQAGIVEYVKKDVPEFIIPVNATYTFKIAHIDGDAYMTFGINESKNIQEPHLFEADSITFPIRDIKGFYKKERVNKDISKEDLFYAQICVAFLSNYERFKGLDVNVMTEKLINDYVGEKYYLEAKEEAELLAEEENKDDLFLDDLDRD